MRNSIEQRSEPIALWRARAALGGRNWSAAAYGFGGPDVADAVGSPDEIGRELTSFLNGLGWQEVEAERRRTGRFFVRVQVEPREGDTGTLANRRIEVAADDRIGRWEAIASAGNGRGIFDACYSYGNCQGDEGHLLGTADELGAELARVLTGLTRHDVETMRHETNCFFIELVVELSKGE